MNTNEAIDIIKALDLLAETLGLELRQAAINICMLNEDKYKILQNAAKTYSNFLKMNIIDKGKVLGITIHEQPSEQPSDGRETEFINNN